MTTHMEPNKIKMYIWVTKQNLFCIKYLILLVGPSVLSMYRI